MQPLHGDAPHCAFPLQSEQTMTTASLESRIEESFAAGAELVSDVDALDTFLELRNALEAGTLRAAEPDAAAPTGWRVNAWVKRGILLGFRIGALTRDERRRRAQLPRQGDLPGAQLHAGGRRAHRSRRQLGALGCVCGARRGGDAAARTSTWAHTWTRARMVDSHALVGSCAQIGAPRASVGWGADRRRAGAGECLAGHY